MVEGQILHRPLGAAVLALKAIAQKKIVAGEGNSLAALVFPQADDRWHWIFPIG
jgi:hypothetical protein